MGMTRLAATCPDGRAYRRAVAGPFEVTRLVFPPNYRHGAVEPDRDYLVAVLDGAVVKSFSRDAATLSRGSLALVPAGDTHSSSFSTGGAQVLAVRASGGEGTPLLGSSLTGRRHDRVGASTALGWQIAGELETHDMSSDLALEGLVLQLLATAERASLEPPARACSWLSTVRDLLHDQLRASRR